MFIIDVQSKDPIYEQIKKQISRFIKLEVLKPNDRLPSVRTLAVSLGVNPNTVSKAYQELEAEGVVYTMNKKGVFVAENGFNNSINKIYLESFKKIVFDCMQLNIKKDELNNIIEEVYEGGK